MPRRKGPAHLRDVSVSQNSLEHALLKAQDEGLDIRQTAERLAQAGFGHVHHYPIRFFQNKNTDDTPNYAVGDLVVATPDVSHLPVDVTTHNVSKLFRVEQFTTQPSYYGYASGAVDKITVVRNLRTGRCVRHYTNHFWRAEIND